MNYEADTVVVGAGQAGIAMSEHLSPWVSSTLFLSATVLQSAGVPTDGIHLSQMALLGMTDPGLHFKGFNGDEIVPKE